MFHLIANKSLPFKDCSPFTVSQHYQTSKNHFLERLENNNFTKEMLKHINKLSKDNYKCKYYDSNNIQSLIKSHQESALKAFHVNISSIVKNGLDLTSYLESLKLDFDIIMLTETRQTTTGYIEFIFPDYDIFLDNPETSKGGASIMVRKNTFRNVKLATNNSLNLKNKCNCTHCEIDNIWISLKLNDKDVLIGCIYRHPKADIGKSHFSDNLNEALKTINDNTLTVIAGDINIDLIKTNNAHTEQYINNVLQNSFIPCITIPTRITNHSASILDHILLKTPKNLIHTKVSAGNLITDISDHLPNIIFIDITIITPKERPLIRLFTPKKISEYLLKIEDEKPLINYVNKSNIDDNNLQSTYNEFNTNLTETLNKYFPLVRQSRKKFKEKPYITNGIRVSMKSREALHKIYLENPTEENERNFKNKRNRIVDIVRKAESDYYAAAIKNHADSNRQLWKTFGKMLNKNKTNHTLIDKIISRNVVTTDQQEITEEVNDYFCNIGSELASKFKDSNNNDFKKYLGNPSQQSLFLRRVTEKEVVQEINKLTLNKSPGQDEFTPQFLKISANRVVPVLCELFNLSIKTGEYPDLLKVAKVLPIFKKGDQTLCSNYRPISVLSCINKILEKIIYKRIYEFLEKQNILYEFQYGFRKGHSTEHALIEIVDKIKLAMDNNELTCGIFLDLSKAFDTVNHETLIYKLDHYGIRGPANNLLKSYLSNRKQFVKIGKHKSKLKNITCGVPQGSVLGPLLFILYINDLHKACTTGNTRIFADDTNIFFKCKDIKEITTIGSQIMTQLQGWFKANKLTLNSEKSSFIIFRSKRKKQTNIPEQIKYEDTSINRCNSIKYLGVILDEHLDWNEHIHDLCNKLKRYFKTFYCIRRYLNIDQVKTIYYALIYSRIKYGISVFGTACKKKLTKIQILQNKLLKVLLAKTYRYSTNSLHNELNILKVTDIAKLNTLTFVHNFFHDKLPQMFKQYYKLFGDIHSFNTRGSPYQIIIERHSSNIGHSTMKIRGANLWNQISEDIKKTNDVKKFRKHIKNSILPYQED